ncbi:hypothetical protein BH10PSE7_BH10PSE7_34040 [soil metagenome]
MSDSATRICSFSKNQRERVVISIDAFKGHNLLDIRAFAVPQDGGEEKPTPKGITIRVCLLDSLLEGLADARAELVRRGLLDSEARHA